MHIDLPTLRIRKNEIEVLCVRALKLAVASCFQQSAQGRYVLMLHGDVQIFVGTSLQAKQGVHTPTSVEMELDTVFLHEPKELDDIFSAHFAPSQRVHFISDRKDSHAPPLTLTRMGS